MLGFELNVNGEKISASLENGVVSLIVTQISRGSVNSVELDLRGLDTTELNKDEMLDWYNKLLNEGDEFCVKIKNITLNSEPRKSEKREFDFERKIKSYHILKKELEEKGLI